MYKMEPGKLDELREALEKILSTLTDENTDGDLKKAIICVSSAAGDMKDWTADAISPGDFVVVCNDLEIACKELSEAQYYDVEEQDLNDILFELRQVAK